jgi:hypothetical protein
LILILLDNPGGGVYNALTIAGHEGRRAAEAALRDSAASPGINIGKTMTITKIAVPVRRRARVFVIWFFVRGTSVRPRFESRRSN